MPRRIWPPGARRHNRQIAGDWAQYKARGAGCNRSLGPEPSHGDVFSTRDMHVVHFWVAKLSLQA